MISTYFNDKHYIKQNRYKKGDGKLLKQIMSNTILNRRKVMQWNVPAEENMFKRFIINLYNNINNNSFYLLGAFHGTQGRRTTIKI